MPLRCHPCPRTPVNHVFGTNMEGKGEQNQKSTDSKGFGALRAGALAISLAPLFLERGGDIVHVFGEIGQRAHFEFGEKK